MPSPPSSQQQIDAALDALVTGKQVWALLDNAQRADILRECLLLLKQHLKAIAESATARKGTYESGLGEEMYVHKLISVLVPAWNTALLQLMISLPVVAACGWCTCTLSPPYTDGRGTEQFDLVGMMQFIAT